MYRIKEVDASADEVAEIIRAFNSDPESKFPDLTDAELDGANCYWWIAYCDKEPVGFAGMVPSRQWANVGYLKRAGVSPAHRGRGLQLRFFRVREKRAKQIGWSHLISETTDTIYSANNFIRAGYRLYEPQKPWAFQRSLYWIKQISP
jgi:GNAT superfamily N-acetyltransferase